MVPFIPFPPSSLSLCLHGCSWGHIPSSLGATEPPPASFITWGAAFPSVQLWFLFAQAASGKQQKWGTAMGHLLCPQPRDLLLPLSASPCLPAHELCMPQDWGASGIQSTNSKVADCCFFSLFTCFFPRAEQLQPRMCWCSGKGGCSCSQPREQSSSCVALTPALTPGIPSQPQAAAPGALCSPASTAIPELGCREDGLKL